MNLCREKWIFFLRWGGSALLSSVGISTSVPALVRTLQSWWSAWTWRWTWTRRDFEDIDRQASIYQKKRLQVQRYHGARQKWRQVTKRELLSQIWTPTVTCLTIVAGRHLLSLLTDRRLMEQFGLRHRLVLASVKEQDFGKKNIGSIYSINNLARGKIITNTSLCGILISWVLKYHCPFNILIEWKRDRTNCKEGVQ